MYQNNQKNPSHNSSCRSESSKHVKKQILQGSGSNNTTFIQQVKRLKIVQPSDVGSGHPAKSINSYGSQEFSIASMPQSASYTTQIFQQSPLNSNNISYYSHNQSIKSPSQQQLKEPLNISNVSSIFPKNFNEHSLSNEDSLSEGLIIKQKQKSFEVKAEAQSSNSNESSSKISYTAIAKVFNLECSNCHLMKQQIEILNKKMEQSDKRNNEQFSQITSLLIAMNSQKSSSGSSSGGSSHKSKKSHKSKNSQRDVLQSQSNHQESFTTSVVTENEQLKIKQTSSLNGQRNLNPEDPFKKNKINPQHRQDKHKKRVYQNQRHQIHEREFQRTQSQLNYSQSSIHITKKKLLNRGEKQEVKTKLQPIPFTKIKSQSQINVTNHEKQNTQINSFLTQFRTDYVKGQKCCEVLYYENQKLVKNQGDNKQKHRPNQGQEQLAEDRIKQPSQGKQIIPRTTQSKKQKKLNRPNGNNPIISNHIIADQTSIVQGMKEKSDKLAAFEFNLEKNCCGVFPSKR